MYRTAQISHRPAGTCRRKVSCRLAPIRTSPYRLQFSGTGPGSGAPPARSVREYSSGSPAGARPSTAPCGSCCSAAPPALYLRYRAPALLRERRRSASVSVFLHSARLLSLHSMRLRAALRHAVHTSFFAARLWTCPALRTAAGNSLPHGRTAFVLCADARRSSSAAGQTALVLCADARRLSSARPRNRNFRQSRGLAGPVKGCSRKRLKTRCIASYASFVPQPGSGRLPHGQKFSMNETPLFFCVVLEKPRETTSAVAQKFLISPPVCAALYFCLKAYVLAGLLVRFSRWFPN